MKEERNYSAKKKNKATVDGWFKRYRRKVESVAMASVLFLFLGLGLFAGGGIGTGIYSGVNDSGRSNEVFQADEVKQPATYLEELEELRLAIVELDEYDVDKKIGKQTIELPETEGETVDRAWFYVRNGQEKLTVTYYSDGNFQIWFQIPSGVRRFSIMQNGVTLEGVNGETNSPTSLNNFPDWFEKTLEEKVEHIVGYFYSDSTIDAVRDPETPVVAPAEVPAIFSKSEVETAFAGLGNIQGVIQSQSFVIQKENNIMHFSYDINEIITSAIIIQEGTSNRLYPNEIKTLPELVALWKEEGQTQETRQVNTPRVDTPELELNTPNIRQFFDPKLEADYLSTENFLKEKLEADWDFYRRQRRWDFRNWELISKFNSEKSFLIRVEYVPSTRGYRFRIWSDTLAVQTFDTVIELVEYIDNNVSAAETRAINHSQLTTSELESITIGDLLERELEDDWNLYEYQNVSKQEGWEFRGWGLTRNSNNQSFAMRMDHELASGKHWLIIWNRPDNSLLVDRTFETAFELKHFINNSIVAILQGESNTSQLDTSEPEVTPLSLEDVLRNKWGADWNLLELETFESQISSDIQRWKLTRESDDVNFEIWFSQLFPTKNLFTIWKEPSRWDVLSEIFESIEELSEYLEDWNLPVPRIGE